MSTITTSDVDLEAIAAEVDAVLDGGPLAAALEPVEIAPPTVPAFECSAYAFRQAAAVAAKSAVKRAGALPVLTGLRIVAEGGEVWLTGTDLATTTTVKVYGAVVDQPGSCVLAASFLDKATKGATRTKDKDMLVCAGESATDAIVEVGRTTLAPHMLPLDKFPADTTDLGVGAATIDTAILADVFGAASTDDERPVLAAVAIFDTAVVATDSYRLHIVDGLPSFGVGDDHEDALVVPRPGVKAAIAIGGTVHMQWGERTIRFVGPGCTVTSCLVTSISYPRYQGLVPTSPPINVVLDADGFRQVVAELLPWAVNATPLHLTATTDKVTATVAVRDVADARQEIPASGTGLPADGLTVGFNPKYLAGALAGMTHDVVTLEATDERKPVIFNEPAFGGTRRRLLMPVRIS